MFIHVVAGLDGGIIPSKILQMNCNNTFLLLACLQIIFYLQDKTALCCKLFFCAFNIFIQLVPNLWYIDLFGHLCDYQLILPKSVFYSFKKCSSFTLWFLSRILLLINNIKAMFFDELIIANFFQIQYVKASM